MRFVCSGKGEDIGMAHPAGNRRVGAIGEAWPGIDEGRAAGAGAEIFIAATNDEIGIAAAGIDGHGTGRMRDVPDGEYALFMRSLGDTGHVPAFARAIINMAQGGDGDVLVQSGDGFVFRRAENDAQIARKSVF